MSKKILVGSDHAGKKVKNIAIKALKELKIEYYDCSPKNNKTDDYPDFAKLVAEEISTSSNRIGLLVCGTGIGISIAANKIKGVRAALVHTKKESELARKHNDANILVLPGPYSSTKLTLKKTKEIIKSFYNTKFEGGRHKRRVEKISALESGFLS